MGYYNRDFAGGKWKHFMDQSHLGYTNWADPPVNSLRAIKLKELVYRKIRLWVCQLRVLNQYGPEIKMNLYFLNLTFSTDRTHYIDIYNKGKGSITYMFSSEDPWIKIDKTKGPFGFDDRMLVTVDWKKTSKGMNHGTVKISGINNNIIVGIKAFNPAEVNPESLTGFIEGNGYVSIEAEHFKRQTMTGTKHWSRIEDYGHSLSAMRATAEVDAPPAIPGKDSPCLEYQMYLFNTGTIDVTSVFSPTLNFMSGRALQYAISFDNDLPQVITLVPEEYNARNGNADWEKSVSDNRRLSHSTHVISKAGYHTLKIFMIDPGVVLQNIIVNSGGLKPSYLGPPESFFKPADVKK